MSETITSVYAQIPIPKFYGVTFFEEAADGDLFVGGLKNSRFVRFRVDHMARTLRPWVGRSERLGRQRRS